MKRINKYNINKNNEKDNYYYIKDINNNKYVNKAKEKLKKNKIILGNYYNKNSDLWDSYCLVPHNNSIVFLYKSVDGKNPSEELVSTVQEITGGGYVAKINKISQKKVKELSEVDAIENNKKSWKRLKKVKMNL